MPLDDKVTSHYDNAAKDGDSCACTENKVRGVDGERLAVPALTASELAERMVDNTVLLDVFDRQAVRLGGVLQVMAGTFALIVTDAEGCCLRLHACLLSSEDLESLGLRRGALLREGFVGNSGVATALVRGVPAAFRGPEHVKTVYRDWVTLGVPMQAHDGGTIGVLGLYLPAGHDPSCYLDLLMLAARGIEAGVARMTLQQRLAEKAAALDAAQKETPRLLDALPVGVMVVDAKFNIVIWNRAAERITGLDAGSVLGKSLFSYASGLANPSLAEVQARIAEALYGGNCVCDQEVAVRFKGQDLVFSYSIHSAGGEGEDFGKCLVLFEDVTSRRRLEGRVKRADEKMELIGQALDSLPFGMAITDSFGRVVYVNRAFQSKTGYEIEDVIGMRLSEMGRVIRGVPDAGGEKETASAENDAYNMPVEGCLYSMHDKTGGKRLFVLDNYTVESGRRILGMISLWDDPGPEGRLPARLPDHSGEPEHLRVAEAAKEGLRVAILWEQVRMHYGMTPAQFAQQVLDLNLSQYLRYEKGAKFPSLPNALALARKVNYAIENIYCLLDHTEKEPR